MVMIMGTSTCHMVLSRDERTVPGMCGVVQDGIIPGYFGYEAGKSCVGDHFDWVVRQGLPSAYHEEARQRGLDLHELLQDKASRLRAGESGLLALDWWNGNRSILVDAGLSGLLIGATLATTPEETYRALVEATAFGTRLILETLEANGVPIHEIVACGGLAERSPFVMQLYADITGRPFRISASDQTPALGSAMFASVAAGSAAGGHATIEDAAQAMARLKPEAYLPDLGDRDVYDGCTPSTCASTTTSGGVGAT